MSKNINIIVFDSKKIPRQVKPAFLKAWTATQMLVEQIEKSQ